MAIGEKKAAQLKKQVDKCLKFVAEPELVKLAQMTFAPAEEKKTCWSYRRIAQEDHLQQIFVGKPELLYVLKNALTGATGKWLRITIEVLP